MRMYAQNDTILETGHCVFENRILSFDMSSDKRSISGEHARSIPLDGLPFDLVRELSLCTAEQLAEVRELLDEFNPNLPPGAYRSYTQEQIDRVLALVRRLRSANEASVA